MTTAGVQPSMMELLSVMPPSMLPVACHASAMAEESVVPAGSKRSQSFEIAEPRTRLFVALGAAPGHHKLDVR